jgi:hypothetical protein
MLGTGHARQILIQQYRYTIRMDLPVNMHNQAGNSIRIEDYTSGAVKVAFWL